MGESKRAIEAAQKHLAEVQFRVVCERLQEAQDAVGGLALILAAQALRDRLDSDMMDAFDAANDEADRKQKEGYEEARRRDWDAVRFTRD